MRHAYYYDKYGYIEYYQDCKCPTIVSCNTIFNARKLIAMSGVQQELIEVK